MRPDLYKVLLERPRLGAYSNSATVLKGMRNAYRQAKHFKLDASGDVCDMYSCKKMPMRCRSLGHQIKCFNENLNPLERYLRSQVGRLWDDVYSEIARGLRPTSTIQQHLRMHVMWAVSTKVQIGTDGRVWDIASYRYRCDIVNNLYVHPTSGLLTAGTFKFDQEFNV